MPPSDEPMTVCRWSIPSARQAERAAAAMSSTESWGKSTRYGAPVSGLIDAGPVEPKQLPSEFTQMTKKRSVSIGWPGPIMYSHQPGEGSAGDEAACAFGESPVNSSRALSPRPLSRPQVS
ncbi:MAG: hypothetical protein U5K43_07695 [Halofilum sp. (in: g-proteobacteria)]|nr:hypothetical protein [Halofilum sp. (in: g-proteobacteria)]